MRRKLFYLIPILLIILSGCNDIVGGEIDINDFPVEITTLARGGILFPGDEIEIEYTINDTETIPDRLEINVTGPDGQVVSSLLIEEQPLSGRVSPIDLDKTAEEGLYTVEFDFYSGEEPFYSETREFFLTSSVSTIKSINSYPPVLYPGGGGLFHADIECSGEDYWLRWTLDGENIAEGSASDGYESIEIEAPGFEGVYSLDLEVFPFAPAGKEVFKFKSVVNKNIPLYVNTEQKSGISEFGPVEDFYNLFHFRGSFYNSADSEKNGIEELEFVGHPQLAVRNGLLGYYLDTNSGFSAADLMVPVENGRLQSFSVMTAVIPYNIESEKPESGSETIFYSGLADGSFYISCDILPEGRLSASVYIDGESYVLLSENTMFHENIYSAVSFAVQPADDELKIAFYLDGVPDSEISYQASGQGLAPWMNIHNEEKKAVSRLFGAGNFEGLVDEIGVYHNELSSESAVDPEQFRRAMELEYGKSLMYAEGFDGNSEELIFNSSEVSVSESRLLIPPGAAVEFPPIYPGYEEVVFRVEFTDSLTGKSEAVFFSDGGRSEIVRVDLDRKSEYPEPVMFSLIFSSESIGLKGTDSQDGETGFTGDFSGIGYSIRNNDSEKELGIESILIIRKNINISEIKTDESGRLLSLGALQVGKNYRS